MYGQQTAQIYFFKPLTMIFIIALACTRENWLTFYGLMITSGLLFSLAGDVLLIPERFFVQGLTSFLLAHICYLAAFAHAPVAPWLLLPFLLFIVLFLRLLRGRLGKLKLPVTIYAVTIAAMGWQAVDRCLAHGEQSNLLAAAGAIFFVASDTILAYDKFKQPFRLARLLVLSTYFTAQWLIALSVG